MQQNGGDGNISFWFYFIFILYFKNLEWNKFKEQPPKNRNPPYFYGNTITALLIDINNNDRFKFWNYINTIQIDKGYKDHKFGDTGYISGLFSLFNNNSKFCIECEKNILCYVYKKESTVNLYNISLISISMEDLNYNNLDNIICLKFFPRVANCECVNNTHIMCSNISFKFMNKPDFLFFILDIAKLDYFNNNNNIVKLFAGDIKLFDLFYEIRVWSAIQLLIIFLLYNK